MRQFLSAGMALLLLVLSATPAFAITDSAHPPDKMEEITPGTNDYTVTDHQESTLALGVTQDIYTVKMKSDKEQNKIYLATVDLNRDDLTIHANINQNNADGTTWKLTKLTKQMEAAQANHSNPDSANYVPYFNVVAGVNAGYYGMSNGKPLDAFAMEGKVYLDSSGHEGGERPYFVMRKDGTPVIGWSPEEWRKMKEDQENPIWDAVGGSDILIWEGKIVAPANSDYEKMQNARAVIGIKADGRTVVFGEVDGLQKPNSRGMTMRELAEVMYKAGCQYALNLDGGGSATYVSKQEDGTLKVLNSPADGYERTVSSTLYVASTTSPSGDFGSVELYPEHEYVTPNSTVKIDAAGFSKSHAPMEIPKDAVWRLAEGSTNLGTVSEGQFVGNGNTGEATIQVAIGDQVFGKTTIHVVHPDHLEITNGSVLSYEGSIPLRYIASYGEGTGVTTKPEDFEFQLSDSQMGKLETKGENTIFTACNQNLMDQVKGGTITIKYKYTDLSEKLELTFGKKSEILFDFESEENGNDLKSWFGSGIQNWNVNASISVEKVDKEHGMVHDGNYALKVTCDWENIISDADDKGWEQMVLGSTYDTPNDAYAPETDPWINVKDAISYGAWIWVPDEDTIGGRCIWGYNDQTHETNYQYGKHNLEGQHHDEGYWIYEQYSFPQTADDHWVQTKSSIINFMLSTQGSFDSVYKSMNSKLVYYVDSIWMDYSEATPDRDAPEFGVASVVGVEDDPVMQEGVIYQGIESDTVQFRAQVEDQDALNKTGLEKVSAEIDGTEVPSSYSGGAIETEAVTLAPGTHSVVFYAEDGAGNQSELKRKFETTGNQDAATIVVEPHDKTANQIPIGSVYYVDVKATDVSKIQTVTLTADLVNNAKWELAHADVDPKFELTWKQDGPIDKDENYATVTLTRTKDYEEGDGNVLASLPVRAWGAETYPTKFSGRDENDHINKNSDWGPAQAWQHKLFYPVDVKFEVDKGEIEYVDGYEPETLPIFGSAKIQVDTELYDFSETVVTENPDKDSWHVHGETKPIPDKVPTCTSNGYKNRKVCKVCGSPVTEEDWGETVYTEGHKYAPDADGKMVCTVCGLALTGELDGKIYEDGLPVGGESGKWVGDRYYVQGTPVSAGLHLIENVWYNFDEDGICKDQLPYTGFIDTTDENNLIPVQADGQSTTNAFHDYTYSISGLEKDHTYTYVVGGESPITPESNGWFNLRDDLRFHMNPTTGELHLSTHAVDTRTCARTGNFEYTCEECEAKDEGEVLFFEGHNWDENHVCTNCGFEGIDIGKEGVLSLGQYYKYTGSEILPDYTLWVRGKGLNTRYDAYGYDGGAKLDNNVDIGVATLTIEGRGDYYGTISENFTIVPESIDDRLTATQTIDTAVHLSWPAMAGADYYSVYQQNPDNTWTLLSDVKGGATSYDVQGLSLGDSYRFRVASRAERNGETYYCVRWAYAEGTIDHVWSAPEEGSFEATCTTEGRILHTCTDCGITEDAVLPALGHRVEEWTTTVEPTTSKEGQRQGTCTVCGETVTETIEKLPPASNGGGSGGFGSGGSTDPANKQDTVTNSDGSVTTTTTNPDGSKTESTTYADGTVTEKTTEKDGTVTEKTAKPDGTNTEKVTKPDGSAVECTTTPEGITGQTNTDATGNVTSANVTIPENVKSEFVTAPVKVPAAKSSKEAAAIELRVGSADVSRVEIPVTEFGPGTVAILVHEDGTEEVVRDCTIGENGVILNVEGDVTLKIVERSQNFTDVASGNWASDAVEFVAARELFQGTGNQQFTPEGNMTRGMLVTVLYRLAYEPEAAQVDFGDIDQQAYYSDAVAWAASNGVVTGYSDHAFGPDDDITREQLATILYRYAKNHTATTGQTAALSTFADASQISPYAAEAMSWAVSSGLINGVGNNQLAPEGEATRAQVATMLMRFCEKIA